MVRRRGRMLGFFVAFDIFFKIWTEQYMETGNSLLCRDVCYCRTIIRWVFFSGYSLSSLAEGRYEIPNSKAVLEC